MSQDVEKMSVIPKCSRRETLRLKVEHLTNSGKPNTFLVAEGERLVCLLCHDAVSVI